MIARIEGKLIAITGEKALLEAAGGITYELMLPCFAASRLGDRIGQNISLHTLQFLESNNQGATFYPRMAGFLNEQDKVFYELLVTCKGIGLRRALRAMALPGAQIAAAIEDRDLNTLQSLPEIGKRTAETVVTTLRGKVARFLDGSMAGGDGTTDQPAPPRSSAAREALEALVMLGEKRTDALRWIDQVMADDADAGSDAQTLIAAVYRIKSA